MDAEEIENIQIGDIIEVSIPAKIGKGTYEVEVVGKGPGYNSGNTIILALSEGTELSKSHRGIVRNHVSDFGVDPKHLGKKYSVWSDNMYRIDYERPYSEIIRVISPANKQQSAPVAVNNNKSDGEWCKFCGNFFQYAVPNQPDGTLACWSCRDSRGLD